ncbi:hypothetical protein [Thermogutta sp.]|uniref:hypothetical protein n=1 Tax=Thermogutta sp. TaxID=1962930 RepID=UPI00321F9CAC
MVLYRAYDSPSGRYWTPDFMAALQYTDNGHLGGERLFQLIPTVTMGVWRPSKQEVAEILGVALRCDDSYYHIYDLWEESPEAFKKLQAYCLEHQINWIVYEDDYPFAMKTCLWMGQEDTPPGEIVEVTPDDVVLTVFDPRDRKTYKGTFSELIEPLEIELTPGQPVTWQTILEFFRDLRIEITDWDFK